jgi:hypothetical protein
MRLWLCQSETTYCEGAINLESLQKNLITFYQCARAITIGEMTFRKKTKIIVGARKPSYDETILVMQV